VQVRELAVSTLKERNGLLICGIVVIDQSGESRDVFTQGYVLDASLFVRLTCL
jgi:hypothetical protein